MEYWILYGAAVVLFVLVVACWLVPAWARARMTAIRLDEEREARRQAAGERW
ncbi:hypothetical protein [Streptomyces thermolilacinus]|uniref:hypothetical protein n=1 Tax=Streptomyces thermolilacinus TaxID=285540 RepID=UPI0033DC0953